MKCQGHGGKVKSCKSCVPPVLFLMLSVCGNVPETPPSVRSLVLFCRNNVRGVMKIF